MAGLQVFAQYFLVVVSSVLASDDEREQIAAGVPKSRFARRLGVHRSTLNRSLVRED
ncbi:hypothetical protein [Sinomonas sp.]|uniref:hypothetical protein n=1 Tax=Sinomonas sp. TaxID=1914986 RepID=UPI003F7E5E03